MRYACPVRREGQSLPLSLPLFVAWHEVPGKAPPQESRPVGYGVIRAGVGTDWKIGRLEDWKIGSTGGQEVKVSQSVGRDVGLAVGRCQFIRWYAMKNSRQLLLPEFQSRGLCLLYSRTPVLLSYPRYFSKRSLSSALARKRMLFTAGTLVPMTLAISS